VQAVGGLVINQFGRVPKRGESVTFNGFKFQVLRADSRMVHSLLVERIVAAEPDSKDKSSSNQQPA
jgi:magnesium and cobalt transporter